jgi:predicted adenine nucleotide alpha hydrolase (AANH) superfamily ATPase
MLQNEFDVTAFFYNPNIHPEKEYKQRFLEMRTLMEKWRIPMIADNYDADRWFALVKGFEKEAEGRRRCVICYELRLLKTAQIASENGFEYFATTLSVSPHKKAAVINTIGKKLEKQHVVIFLDVDFKKKDGFKISCQLSKEEGLYRQHYCGCVFSQRNSKDRGRYD